MAIKEISSTDSITVDAVKILIYGQPGLGKTTVALTASNPLILDFDLGAHRAGNRSSGKVIRIDSWNDVGDIMKQSDRYIKPYDTIVIDTVGRCLDYLTAQIIADDPKSGNRNGGLTISGWGSLKSAFASWIKQLVLLKKDVIMIAHDKEEKGDNDIRILRPDVSGGSYAEVLKQADFVGYMYKGLKDVSFLNFNPTEKTIGKNSAKFPILEIPDVVAQPQLLAGKISEMKIKLSGMSEQDMETRKMVELAKTTIATYTTAKQFNDAKGKLGSLQEPMLSQLKSALWKKAQDLGFTYDKATGNFTAPYTVPTESPVNVEALLADSGAKANGLAISNPFDM